LKRALKKRVKVVLENIPNENAQARQQDTANQAVNRRVRKSAAMIGLAISMGATSLLVTRQSDQAQAAEPVGNQNTASSLTAATEAQVKFPTQQLESKAVSNASVPESPVTVDVNGTSQVSGLGAKWQSPTTGISRGFSRQIPTPVVPTVTVSKTNSIYPQSQLATGVNQTAFNPNSLKQTRKLSGTVPAAVQVTTPVVSTATASSTMDVQLKAQQEFALNRLQEKSSRLRNSLAEWRSEEKRGVSVATTPVVVSQPKLVANQASITNQASTVSALTNDLQQPEINEAKSAKLLSRLKQNQAAPTMPEMVAPVESVGSVGSVGSVNTSSNTVHEVKPGDTLARIASLYGTSVSELVKANNLSNANRLQVSQKLSVPVATAGTAQPTIVASNPVDVSSNTIEQSTQSKVGTNTTVASESSVVANNSSIVSSTKVTGNSQTNIATQPSTVQGTETAATTENTNTANNFTGMGGDTPVPTALNGMQGNRQGSLLAQRAKEDKGLQSLQQDIERLREKYRAQQSGASTPNSASNSVVVPTYPQANTAVPIRVPAPYQQARPNVPTVPRVNNVNTSAPFANQNPVAVPIVVAPPARFNNLYPAPLPRANQAAIPIQVPRPMQPRANEPFNPQWNNRVNGNTQNARITVPGGMQDASQSLGAARGITVSPQLPNSAQRLPNTLATVDRYLPQVIDENAPSTNRVGMIWPSKGVLTSGYGMRWGRPHRGIDIAGPVGTPIYAVADGVVERAGWNNGGYGKLVDIRHPDGTMTRYGHNSKILVQAGQQVRQGQQITAMGSTGFSTGPHLHFEIHPGGKGAVNPIAFLPPRV
jgi:murein DD-endopeptidase MepM/ murein hydrolase activator NlpD